MQEDENELDRLSHEEAGRRRPTDSLGALQGAARAGSAFGHSNFADWTFGGLELAAIEPINQYLATENGDYIGTEDGSRIIVGTRQPTSMEYLQRIEEKIDTVLPNLVAYLEAVAPRSHNGPPELVDDAFYAPQQIEVAHASLVLVQGEIRGREPKPEAVKEAASTLWNIASAIGAWLAQRATLAVDTVITTGVKASVTTGLLSAIFGLADVEAGLRAIASMLFAWLTNYAGGGLG